MPPQNICHGPKTSLHCSFMLGQAATPNLAAIARLVDPAAEVVAAAAEFAAD
jgi:hypothetical protein